MDTDVWEFTKDFYEKELGIPKEIVEYLAVIDVISLVASGHSNKTISNTLDRMSEDYIKSICEKFLSFGGWEQDLDVNTYFVYKNTGKTFDSFHVQVESITPFFTEAIIAKAFEVCKKFDFMKKEIGKHYG